MGKLSYANSKIAITSLEYKLQCAYCAIYELLQKSDNDFIIIADNLYDNILEKLEVTTLPEGKVCIELKKEVEKCEGCRKKRDYAVSPWLHGFRDAAGLEYEASWECPCGHMHLGDKVLPVVTETIEVKKDAIIITDNGIFKKEGGKWQ